MEKLRGKAAERRERSERKVDQGCGCECGVRGNVIVNIPKYCVVLRIGTGESVMMIRDISEKEILKGLKSGDEDAYKRIFQAWYEPLCTYAVGLVRDRFQAENIVDDVIFHLWEIRERVEIQASLKGYLFSAVRNRSLNYLASAVRKKYKDISEEDYKLVMDSLTAISKDDVYGKLFEDELKKCLMKELDGLSPECRGVFEKSRFEGKTYKEIADELGISVNTVKYHIKNALTVLRNGLGKYFLAILMIIVSK